MTQIKKEDELILNWCDSIASLIVDAMVDAKLVPMENFTKAVAITSEEIYVRLLLDDYPPSKQNNSL